MWLGRGDGEPGKCPTESSLLDQPLLAELDGMEQLDLGGLVGEDSGDRGEPATVPASPPLHMSHIKYRHISSLSLAQDGR
jgi:hypothetical protein